MRWTCPYSGLEVGPLAEEGKGGMRVLMAVDRSQRSPYIHFLYRTLAGRGLSLTRSVDRVHEPPGREDLLHIHWPEALVGWREPGPEEVRRLMASLDAWRSAGVPLVVTRHNALPHLHRCPEAVELYRGVLERADGVIHLGRASLQELEGSVGGLHAVIPHGSLACEERPDRGAARRELGLPAEVFVVLVFGAIRSHAEQRLLLHTYRKLAARDTLFVVPRWREATRPSWRKEPLERLRAVLDDRLGRRAFLEGNGYADDDEARLHFAAADVVFIPRVEVLNSGVLPEAYGHGRAVVGPLTGNLTEWLEATGNPGYIPGDPEDAARALRAARTLDLDDLGLRNRIFAQEHWSWERVAADHEAFYREIAQTGQEPSG